MVIFYKKWKKYNEIQLTKNKMDLNNLKLINHPPSPVRKSETGEANIKDKPRSGRPVPVSDEKHRKKVEKLTKTDPLYDTAIHTPISWAYEKNTYYASLLKLVAVISVIGL